jgi:hypothetical protein
VFTSPKEFALDNEAGDANTPAASPMKEIFRLKCENLTLRITIGGNPATLVTPTVQCPALIFLTTTNRHVASRAERATKGEKNDDETDDQT